MNAISGGCSLNTCATTMRIARISAWGRKRRTAELIPTPLVSFCRRSDSAGCIIVTIGLPDPGSCFHPSLYIHATCARTRVLQWEWPLPRTLSVAFGLLLQVAAKRGGAIFRTDEILARHRLEFTRIISGLSSFRLTCFGLTLCFQLLQSCFRVTILLQPGLSG